MALGYLTGYSDEAVVWILRNSISKDPRHFSLLHNLQTGYGAHPASCSIDICVPSPSGKVSGVQCAALLLSGKEFQVTKNRERKMYFVCQRVEHFFFSFQNRYSRGSI